VSAQTPQAWRSCEAWRRTIHKQWDRGLTPFLHGPIYPGAASMRHGGDHLAHPGGTTGCCMSPQRAKPASAVSARPPGNTDGMFGDLTGDPFRARGAVGLVIDAGCRDPGERAEMGFPGGRRPFMQRSVKATIGSVNTADNLPPESSCIRAIGGGGRDGVVIVPTLQAGKTWRASAAAAKRRRRGLAGGWRRGIGPRRVRHSDRTLAKGAARYFDRRAKRYAGSRKERGTQE